MTHWLVATRNYERQIAPHFLYERPEFSNLTLKEYRIAFRYYQLHHHQSIKSQDVDNFGF